MRVTSIIALAFGLCVVSASAQAPIKSIRLRNETILTPPGQAQAMRPHPAPPATVSSSPPSPMLGPCPSNSPPRPTIPEQLMQLKQLLDSGVLTEEEFQKAKERVIAGS